MSRISFLLKIYYEVNTFTWTLLEPTCKDQIIKLLEVMGLLYHWFYKKSKALVSISLSPHPPTKVKRGRPGKTLGKVWKKAKVKKKGNNRGSCPVVPMILPTDLWGTESCSDTGVFSVRIWWMAAFALHTWTGNPLISSTRSSPTSSVSTSIRAPVCFRSCREKDIWQYALEELPLGSARYTLNLTMEVDGTGSNQLN